MSVEVNNTGNFFKIGMATVPQDTVLLYTKDASVIRHLAMILQQEGYHVAHISGYKMLAKAVEQMHPSLLILDIYPDDPDISELSSYLHFTSNGNGFAILALLPPQDEQAGIQEEFRSGAFIEKPILYFDLIQKIEELLQEYQEK